MSPQIQKCNNKHLNQTYKILSFCVGDISDNIPEVSLTSSSSNSGEFFSSVVSSPKCMLHKALHYCKYFMISVV